MDIENAASRLRTTIRLIVRRADSVSGANAPTRSEQEVMVWLDEKGSLTPSALAAAVRVRPQTIGQTLDLLDRHGWIKRAPHPDDRRQVLISLSSAGRRALARGRSLRQAWLADELGALNKKEFGTILEAIGILERIAQKDHVSLYIQSLMKPTTPIDLSETALVLIDLQKGIVGYPLVPRDGAEVVRNAGLLAARFRAAGAPVVLVNVNFSARGADALHSEVDQPTPRREMPADWAEIVPELGADSADIRITKRQWGAFYGTELDLQLRRRGIRKIVLAGIATNIGVESTARAAHEHGYALVLVEDAMATQSLEGHRASIEGIFPRLGLVRSTEDVLAACMGSRS